MQRRGSAGDLVVSIPQEKIVSTGDIVVTNRADDNPNIHAEKNGTTAGWLINVKKMIDLNADTYVTGHGDLLTKAYLQRKYDATLARRNQIAAMVKEGKSLDDIKAALPDAPAPGAAPRAGGAPGAGAAAGRQGGGAAGGGRGGPAPLTFVDCSGVRALVAAADCAKSRSLAVHIAGASALANRNDVRAGGASRRSGPRAPSTSTMSRPMTASVASSGGSSAGLPAAARSGPALRGSPVEGSPARRREPPERFRGVVLGRVPPVATWVIAGPLSWNARGRRRDGAPRAI